MWSVIEKAQGVAFVYLYTCSGWIVMEQAQGKAVVYLYSCWKTFSRMMGVILILCIDISLLFIHIYYFAYQIANWNFIL